MTQDDYAPETDQVHLIELVQQYQSFYQLWGQVTDTRRQNDVRAALRQCLEHLWVALADDLRGVAHGWLRSGMAPDTESLTQGMFVHIIEALPRLTIDPSRNVRSLFTTIARRGMINEYRRSWAASGQRRYSQPEPESPPLPGTRHASLGPPHGLAGDRSPAHDAQQEPVDPQSYDAEDRLVARIDSQALLDVVWSYWPTALSGEDLQIMTLRWQTDPPRSFRDIAQQLGSGWEEDAVRQRHHRVLKDTRRYLREQGLLDDPASR